MPAADRASGPSAVATALYSSNVRPSISIVTVYILALLSYSGLPADRFVRGLLVFSYVGRSTWRGHGSWGGHRGTRACSSGRRRARGTLVPRRRGQCPLSDSFEAPPPSPRTWGPLPSRARNDQSGTAECG